VVVDDHAADVAALEHGPDEHVDLISEPSFIWEPEIRTVRAEESQVT